MNIVCQVNKKSMWWSYRDFEGYDQSLGSKLFKFKLLPVGENLVQQSGCTPVYGIDLGCNPMLQQKVGRLAHLSIYSHTHVLKINNRRWSKSQQSVDDWRIRSCLSHKIQSVYPKAIML